MGDILEDIDTFLSLNSYDNYYSTEYLYQVAYENHWNKEEITKVLKNMEQ